MADKLAGVVAPGGYDAADVIASGTRTATNSSPVLDSRGARGCIVSILTTTVPSTGADLAVSVRPCSRTGIARGNYRTTLTRTALVNGETYSLLLYPGIDNAEVLSAGGPQLLAKNGVLTSQFVVNVAHSDAESWTYSVDVDLIP